MNVLENKHQFLRFGVSCRQKYFVLQSSTGTDIALLNASISRSFCDLENCSSLRYEGFIDVNTWKDHIQAWRETGKTVVMPIDINVYGPRNAFQEVGKVFSGTRLYLQHPHHCDSLLKYENPHYLSFPNMPDAQVDTTSASVLSTRATPTSPSNYISSILEDLHQHEYLQNIEIDRRIRIRLLRYVSLRINLTSTETLTPNHSQSPGKRCCLHSGEGSRDCSP
jgi:SWI/SNF-related matrix-associated actin-dependent regulator of chromatin subfamily A3